MSEANTIFVRVEYWVQDTLEAGHWERTELIPLAIAEGLIYGDFGPALERGFLIDKDGNQIKW